MLRLLAASCRPLLAGNHLARQAQSSATTQLFHSTTSRQGLEEFFETPLQEGDKPRTGLWAACATLTCSNTPLCCEHNATCMCACHYNKIRMAQLKSFCD